MKFYADKLCVTPYYLSKVCGHVLSSTPKELIDRQLMMEIKSMLTSTDLTIKEIADLYNFQSTSYLGRFFRRHIGMPLRFAETHSCITVTQNKLLTLRSLEIHYEIVDFRINCTNHCRV